MASISPRRCRRLRPRGYGGPPAIIALEALSGLPASVGDIRAFGVEQWCDFTKLVNAA
jgi:hypothetical protein